ncbi:hypothetical protein [Compostibacter hankyongensis]|uniref:Uncharacterized protein n=1 Tax=Compostibacter hankyongensis TaxID=1007089 RepID=A0ABP8GAT1_9BACT
MFAQRRNGGKQISILKGYSGIRCIGIGLIILLYWGNEQGKAQALLPNISVVNKNGQNYLSWTSGYNSIRQIGIQRSQDSLYNYATIGYAGRPSQKVNSYTDRKPYAGVNFYRLFIQLSNGSYFFSNPARSVMGATGAAATPAAFQPSLYVYTNTEGNINISLPDAGKKQYQIRFFDADGHPLFELNDIKESPLMLDKSNFLQSGLVNFELYEDGKLKEKWKFFIPDQW